MAPQLRRGPLAWSVSAHKASLVLGLASNWDGRDAGEPQRPTAWPRLSPQHCPVSLALSPALPQPHGPSPADIPAPQAPCWPHLLVEVPVHLLLSREAHHATDDATVLAVPALVADLCPAILVAHLHDTLCHRQLLPGPGHHRPQADLLHVALLGLRGTSQPRLALHPVAPAAGSPFPRMPRGCRHPQEMGSPSQVGNMGRQVLHPCRPHPMALGSQGPNPILCSQCHMSPGPPVHLLRVQPGEPALPSRHSQDPAPRGRVPRLPHAQAPTQSRTAAAGARTLGTACRTWSQTLSPRRPAIPRPELCHVPAPKPQPRPAQALWLRGTGAQLGGQRQPRELI